MHLALVQTLHRARGSPEFPQISIDGAMTSSCRSTLHSRPRRYDFVPTQILHFQALLPLNFIFLCTLHWCKRCTGLEVAQNFRKFPLTALCGIDERVVSRPVIDVTLFAPSKVCICRLSFPLASFSYAPWNGASTAQARGSPEFPQTFIHRAMRN